MWLRDASQPLFYISEYEPSCTLTAHRCSHLFLSVIKYKSTEVAGEDLIVAWACCLTDTHEELAVPSGRTALWVILWPSAYGSPARATCAHSHTCDGRELLWLCGEAWAETLPVLNAIPELMPAGSAVSTGLFVSQSHILKKHHVDNFLNKFCTNALFPPNGNVALLNN